jgi:hypothetical protein
MKVRTLSGAEYYDSNMKLDHSKDRLFMTGDVSKWDADFVKHAISKSDVLNNKELAKKVMLPK